MPQVSLHLAGRYKERGSLRLRVAYPYATSRTISSMMRTRIIVGLMLVLVVVVEALVVAEVRMTVVGGLVLVI